MRAKSTLITIAAILVAVLPTVASMDGFRTSRGNDSITCDVVREEYPFLSNEPYSNIVKKLCNDPQFIRLTDDHGPERLIVSVALEQEAREIASNDTSADTAGDPAVVEFRYVWQHPCSEDSAKACATMVSWTADLRSQSVSNATMSEAEITPGWRWS